MVLGVLFVGAFVMGSAELVVVGILDLVAADLGVPVSAAGGVVTAYAVGIGLGGPVLSAVFGRSAPRTVLVASMAAYVVASSVAMAGPDLVVVLGARLAAGAMQGLFLGAAFAIAAGVVPAERLGRAISAVIGGIAAATALGVPLGTSIGRAFGWRAVFGCVVVAGLLVLALLPLVPALPRAGAARMATQLRHALAARVLAMLGCGVLLVGGQYAALTYLASYLTGVTGVAAGTIPVLLLVYGLCSAVGGLGGGRVADRSPSTALLAANVVLVASIGLLGVVDGSVVLVTVALGVWGLVGFGLIPSLQHRIVSLAGPGRDLAATMPASAINGGIAIGSLLGGWAIDAHGPRGPMVAGLVVCAAATPVTWATRFLRPPSPVPVPPVSPRGAGRRS